MKYLVLLRGINVGGNNIIKMASLTVCLEKAGFKNVTTFIQSGNVVFESAELSIEKLTKKMEALLSKTFNYKARVVVLSLSQMKKVVAAAPKDWNTRDGIRCNVAFMRPPIKPKLLIAELQPKVGIDVVSMGPGVVYMSTSIKGHEKSGLVKMIGTPLYKELTIRNFNTTRKLLQLMEK